MESGERIGINDLVAFIPKLFDDTRSVVYQVFDLWSLIFEKALPEKDQNGTSSCHYEYEAPEVGFLEDSNKFNS